MLQIERQMIFLWKRIRPPYVYLHNFQWVSCERRPWHHLLIFPIWNDINIFCHKLIMLLEPWLWMEPENLSDNSINFVTSKNIWVFDPWFSPSFTTEKNKWSGTHLESQHWGSEVQRHLWLPIWFWASLVYMRPCVRKWKSLGCSFWSSSRCSCFMWPAFLKNTNFRNQYQFILTEHRKNLHCLKCTLGKPVAWKDKTITWPPRTAHLHT